MLVRAAWITCGFIKKFVESVSNFNTAWIVLLAKQTNKQTIYECYQHSCRDEPERCERE